jgi:hypothetical protein
MRGFMYVCPWEFVGDRANSPLCVCRFIYSMCAVWSPLRAPKTGLSDMLRTSWVYYLGLLVEFVSWVYWLSLLVGFTGCVYYLSLLVGFTS